MAATEILIADDDPEIIQYLETTLLCHDYPVVSAKDGNEAVQVLKEREGRIALVILDLMMPGRDGISTLHEVRKTHPDLPVVILSCTTDPDQIVLAMKSGATEFLTKPAVHQKLLNVVQRIVPPRPRQLDSEEVKSDQPEHFVRSNRQMRALADCLGEIAEWEFPIVIRGESGVGKEVIAKEIHRLSPRAGRPFVKVNCAAIPSELLESELFGYERGAFTGAFKSKPGKFEFAKGGIVFLDEIGDMDMKLQAKLLHVLQDKEIHRLGGLSSVPIDVQVIAATHNDLEAAIETGRFREDLYYRLNVVSVYIPSLRDRRDEILPLAQHFLHKHRRADRQVPEIAPILKHALLSYEWPGNVRELENVMRRYLVFRNPEELARSLGPSSAKANGAVGAAPVSGSISGEARTEVDQNTGYSPPPAYEGRPLAGRGVETADKSGAEGEGFETPPSMKTDSKPSETDDVELHSESVLNPTRSSREGEEGEAKRVADKAIELEQVLNRLVSLAGSAAVSTDRSVESHRNANDAGAGGPDGPKGDDGLVIEPPVSLEAIARVRDEAERNAIVDALKSCQWNRKEAARKLNVDYRALLYKMKKLGVG